MIYLLPTFFHRPTSPVSITEDTVLTRLIDSLQQHSLASVKTPGEDFEEDIFSKPGFAPSSLFFFDPNTLDAAGWKRLGLSPRAIRTLLNYRNKGGRFYKKEDLKKIWGLPAGFYEQVQDHIQLPMAEKNNAFAEAPPRRHKTLQVVDVNSVDSAGLEALPGIGSRLAQRIIHFRDRLGGFHSLEQVGETYGLADSNFRKLLPYLSANNARIKKININTATKEELKTHPYIRWNLANAIVEYRRQHGNFKELADLKKIVLVDELLFGKISPYLVTE